MTYARQGFLDETDTIPRIPPWVTSGRAQASEDVAFLSGASLSHLHLVVNTQSVPQTLLRARLALRAAEACVTHQGRPERAGDLRDAVAFLQPGDGAGPAGDVYLSWRRAVERPVSAKSLHRAVPGIEPEQIAEWLDGCDPRMPGQGTPVARAAAVLETVLSEAPRQDVAALILADAALAQTLGWTHMCPVLACGLKRADLRQDDADLRLACHRAVVRSVAEATRTAVDLARRAARLQEVAPKLRARGADDAVAVFLNKDAVTPAALTALRSDRAARRLCERLMALGVVRELTGRETFRLYGV